MILDWLLWRPVISDIRTGDIKTPCDLSWRCDHRQKCRPGSLTCAVLLHRAQGHTVFHHHHHHHNRRQRSGEESFLPEPLVTHNFFPWLRIVSFLGYRYFQSLVTHYSIPWLLTIVFLDYSLFWKYDIFIYDYTLQSWYIRWLSSQASPSSSVLLRKSCVPHVKMLERNNQNDHNIRLLRATGCSPSLIV